MIRVQISIRLPGFLALVYTWSGIFGGKKKWEFEISNKHKYSFTRIYMHLSQSIMFQKAYKSIYSTLWIISINSCYFDNKCVIKLFASAFKITSNEWYVTRNTHYILWDTWKWIIILWAKLLCNLHLLILRCLKLMK